MLRPARAAAAACRARQRRRCSAPAAGWQPPTAAAAAAAGASVAAFLQQEHAVRVYREICARKVPDGRVSSALGAARSSGYDSEAVVLTVSRFNRLCEEQGVRDHAECKALLRALHDAGVVFHVPGETDEEIGLVWLCPERIHAAAREEAGVPAADSPSELLGEEGARRLAEIRAELARLEEEKQAADVRVAAWWRNFWAACTLASATQMATMAYLTWIFCEDGWDTVEPWTFFIAQATATVWFLWFVRLRETATNQGADRMLLPAVAARTYAKCGFDWERWVALRRELEGLEQRIEAAAADARPPTL
eukprot:TRINITY_DN34399_c0_g1_i2.p1 TRINITY_DN34399_c0_g1~~TRINITY_DN34399_c0_g1_i2.p1  ORF type:complete len:308 (+),score=101.44 TRINITY_DN34399_c0_g1_i2:70-993(+)